ncbi:MAG: divalent metal cation transporter [Planctomycetaceae bacterium]
MTEPQPSLMSRLWNGIGPGLVTACVVIGPGSILTSSTVGASKGYSMAWVVVVSVVAMQVYMGLGAKFGVVTQSSPIAALRDRGLGWIGILIGLSACAISALFQFGNNLGVQSAFAVFKPKLPVSEWLKNSDWLDFGVVILFNVLSIVFLFSFRNLYAFIERLMATFVGIMLLAFAINLGFALSVSPNPLTDNVLGNELATGSETAGTVSSGSVPAIATTATGWIDLSVLALAGTTFVITAAFYQAYLVRYKGWQLADLKRGLFDTRVSAGIMCLITLMILSTAATVLRGRTLSSVSDVAQQLQPLFGDFGQMIFCIGLFSAAYSSFLINSMIGGFILSDALKLGDQPQDMAPRLMTAGVLVVGMIVAILSISLRQKPVQAIVLAQAITILAAPLMAGSLWWLTTRADLLGMNRNSWRMNVAAGLGFALIFAMASYTAIDKVYPVLAAALGGD